MNNTSSNTGMPSNSSSTMNNSAKARHKYLQKQNSLKGGSPKAAFEVLNKMTVIKCKQSLNFVLMGTPVESNIKETIEVSIDETRFNEENRI